MGMVRKGNGRESEGVMIRVWLVEGNGKGKQEGHEETGRVEEGESVKGKGREDRK